MKSSKDIGTKILAMQLASSNARIAFLEEQLASSVPLERYEALAAQNASLRAEVSFIKKHNEERFEKQNDEHQKEMNSLRRDYEQKIASKDSEIAALLSEQRKNDDLRAFLEAENMDCQTLIKFWQSRQFGRSSEAMVKEMDRLVGKLPESKGAFIADAISMVKRINASHGKPFQCADRGDTEEVKHPASSGKSEKTKKTRKSWKKQLKCSDISKIFEIDLSNLPRGSKIVLRTREDEKCEDVTTIEILFYDPAKFYSKLYKVANCNVPGHDGTMQSKRPLLLFGKIPVDPSFARFYLEMKFSYNRSEGQIIKCLHKLGCMVDQATLNRWMHIVMDCIMKRLLPEVEKEIRESRFTHNDETRILVRVSEDDSIKLKYSTKYIHGILSPSKNLFLMLYKEGSRSHDVQMSVFDGSMIEAFTADRCEIYTALQKEFETPPVRGACWIHFRRYLLNAFHQDNRLEPAVQLLARLFQAEKIISRRRNLTETERVRERQDMCKLLVDAIFKFMQHVKDAGSEYGTLAQRAASYLLEDKDGFCAFLENGLIEISNNAIERCFRRLALGRQNWQQCGSHDAAEHTAFMYSLVECCEMNKIDFGDYIEYILQEMNAGNDNYRALLPNHVVIPEKVKDKDAA